MPAMSIIRNNADQPPSSMTVLVKNTVTGAHGQSLNDGMWDLYIAGQLVDTDLDYLGRTTRVHGTVLAVFSPVLRSHLLEPVPKTTIDRHPTISLDGVVDRAIDVDLLLQFVYRGEAFVPEERLVGLRMLAEMLQIASLTDAIDVARASHEHLSVKQEQITIKVEPCDVDTLLENRDIDDDTSTVPSIGETVECRSSCNVPFGSQRTTDNVTEDVKFVEPSRDAGFNDDGIHKAQEIVAKVFSTYVEAETFLVDFFQRYSHPVRRDNRTSVVHFNSKVSESSRLPLELEVQTFRYVCKHYGYRRKRSKGLRSHQNVLPSGCEFHVVVAYNRSVKGYKIGSYNLEHRNHSLVGASHHCPPKISRLRTRTTLSTQ